MKLAGDRIQFANAFSQLTTDKFRRYMLADRHIHIHKHFVLGMDHKIYIFFTNFWTFPCLFSTDFLSPPPQNQMSVFLQLFCRIGLYGLSFLSCFCESIRKSKLRFELPVADVTTVFSIVLFSEKTKNISIFNRYVN